MIILSKAIFNLGAEQNQCLVQHDQTERNTTQTFHLVFGHLHLQNIVQTKPIL